MTPDRARRSGLDRRVKAAGRLVAREPASCRTAAAPHTGHRGSSASSSCSRAAEELFSTQRLREHPHRRHLRRGRRRQGPVLLVLPDEGVAVRRARAQHAPAAAPGPGGGDGRRRRSGHAHPPGHRGERACSWPSTARTSPCSTSSAPTTPWPSVLREGSDVYADDVDQAGPRGAGGRPRRRRRSAALRHRRAGRGVVVQPRAAQRAPRHRRRRAGRRSSATGSTQALTGGPTGARAAAPTSASDRRARSPARSSCVDQRRVATQDDPHERVDDPRFELCARGHRRCSCTASSGVQACL